MVIGETHGDTIQSGESDFNTLNKAFPVGELPEIQAITIYHDDSLCFGFQLEYQKGIKS
jgi:hypothetical protein